MALEQLTVKVERLRDDCEGLASSIRKQYKNSSTQVRATDIRKEARRIAESWMVEIAANGQVKSIVKPTLLADLNIQFQRLLRFSEHFTLRKKYDGVLRFVLKDFRSEVVIPLKQSEGQVVQTEAAGNLNSLVPQPLTHLGSAFVAHSFHPDDTRIVSVVIRFLETYGVKVLTGKKPKPDTISNKIRKRIEKADIFVGIFTRRDKISGKEKWTTSPWVIDEKAYSISKNKKLILLKELGVDSIGGIQGDYEHINFDRDNLADLILELLELFRSDES